VEVIEAHIHPRHIASESVARKAGLAPTGALDPDGEQIWRLRCEAGARRDP
jgi:hypothetical protein